MTTPRKSLTTLEYDKIVARLAALCQTAPGRALALGLTPSSDFREVLHRQRLTAEARKLLEMKPNTSLSEVREIGTLVHQASLGHTLEPAELLDVLATLSVARTVHETVDRLRVYIPFLAEIADRIADFRELTSAIGRCIDSRGELVDSASPELARLRRETRVAHDRPPARPPQILHPARSAIQEPAVPLPEGHHVLP